MAKSKMTTKNKLSHLTETGAVRMVDVSRKNPILRTAKAYGFIRMAPETIEVLRKDALPKGDAISCARIAGILAAKKTAEWIPLCHPVAITKAELIFTIVHDGIEIQSEIACVDKTGIEMEALTAVSAAALTLYDMAKAIDKNMCIEKIVLLEKIKQDLIS